MIIYTARKGEYVNTLRPMEMEPSKQPRPCHVTCLALSDHGDIVVFCKDQSNSVLRRYSINGKDLSKDENLKEKVVDLFISGEFLVTGGAHGRLEIRSLHRWVFTKLGFLKFGEKLSVDGLAFCKESPQPFARNDGATNQRFNWLDEKK